jgi:hypothetical protein
MERYKGQNIKPGMKLKKTDTIKSTILGEGFVPME